MFWHTIKSNTYRCGNFKFNFKLKLKLNFKFELNFNLKIERTTETLALTPF